MQTQVSKVNGIVTIVITGRIDMNTSPELQAAIDSTEGQTLILDFSGVEYISSAGLRTLFAAYQKYNGDMTIKGANKDVMDIFAMTGFDSVFLFA